MLEDTAALPYLSAAGRSFPSGSGDSCSKGLWLGAPSAPLPPLRKSHTALAWSLTFVGQCGVQRKLFVSIPRCA